MFHVEHFRLFLWVFYAIGSLAGVPAFLGYFFGVGSFFVIVRTVLR